MKHLFLLTLICAFSIAALAQPSIGRSDFYQIGDHLTYHVVDPGDVQPGPAGNGVTWDFSGLQRIPEDDYELYYAAPSVAPNAANFPGANMVQVQDAGEGYTAYSFLQATDSIIQLEGLDIPDLGVVTYSDKSVWIDLPFTFNETQTDPFVGQYTFSFNGISGISHRTGQLTTTYDGYGTLILPNGQRFEGARRLKLVQVVNDEISVQGISITTRVETTTYHWFIPGNGSQAFSITYATSTVTPPGTPINSVIAVYQEVEDTTPAAPVNRGTHLTTQGGDFDTELLFHNPTNSAKTLTLTPLSTSGSAGQPVNVNLPAGTTQRALQQTYFNSSAASFTSSGCSECVFSLGYRAAGLADASTAQVHQNDRTETDYLIYPGEWEYLYDGAAIINAGSGNANVQAIQIDDSGNQVASVNLVSNLEPGGKKLTIFNGLFSTVPNTMIKLHSSQPITVMMLRIDSEGRYLYQNLPLPQNPEASDERWIAHITSESGGFDTDVLVHNTANSSQTITFHPYSTAGAALATVNVTVPANGTRRFAKLDLFVGDTSHAMITGSTDVIVTVGYRSRVENSSTAQIHETTPVGTSFELYPGNWDLLFDGFAIVNTGSATTSLRVSQVNDDGTTTTPVTLTNALAPNAKFLGLLEGVIANNPNSIIKVEANQPLAILALRLTKDSRYLYGNETLPQ